MTDYGHYSSPSYLLFCIAVYTPDFLPHDMSQGPEFIFSTAWVYKNIFQDVMVHHFMRGEVHCGEMFTIVLDGSKQSPMEKERL